MKKTIAIVIRIAIVLAGILIIPAGRELYFYSTARYTPSAVQKPVYQITAPQAATTANFSDVYETGKGTIIIDLAHRNDFNKNELNVLTLRLVSRGLTVKFLSADDDLQKELLGVSKGKSPEDEEKSSGKKPLEKAAAFIIVAPGAEFSSEEVKISDNFTSQGGKLLLVSDPTRSDTGNINSLAIKFGLIFESDYLYNMTENELNYKNILVTDFTDNAITRNLKKIALYTAGSISSANSGIAFASGSTFSNVIETKKKLSPMALTQDSKVLGISDLTFMTEPYNGIFDNNRLIANVADWLMPTNKTASR